VIEVIILLNVRLLKPFKIGDTMKYFRIMMVLLVSLILVSTVSGCKGKTPAEKAGEKTDTTQEAGPAANAGKKVDETMKKAGEKIDETVEKVKESGKKLNEGMEKTIDKIDETMQATKEKVDEMVGE
jgi:peptidoglycan hydrolase CwlO-like protein